MRTKEQDAANVSVHNMAYNILLLVLKLCAGIFGKSQALISDAVHSAADIFETMIVFVGVKMSAKEADEGHPYGHERFECVTAIILSGILIVTGAGIGVEGIQQILDKSYQHTETPELIAAVVAIIAIAAKEVMYWYTRAGAKRTKSTALMADAWHHRLDALCSAGGLLGVLGARFGYPLCDPLASVFICIFILRAAVEIFRETVNKMTDHAVSKEENEEIRTIILSQSGVLGIASLRTRLFGRRTYAEVEILVDNRCSIKEAYKITENVKQKVECHISEMKECVVYTKPAGKGELL